MTAAVRPCDDRLAHHYTYAASVTVHDRVLDADALWAARRQEGALLSILVAVTARAEYPSRGDGDAFRTFLGRHHGWSISVEHRGRQIEMGPDLLEVAALRTGAHRGIASRHLVHWRSGRA